MLLLILLAVLALIAFGAVFLALLFMVYEGIGSGQGSKP